MRQNDEDYMHSPWLANTPSARLKIPWLLWKLNVHYGVHNSPPTDPTLSQFNPVSNLTSNKTNYSSKLGSEDCLFLSHFVNNMLYLLLICPTCNTSSTQITLIIFGQDHKPWSASLHLPPQLCCSSLSDDAIWQVRQTALW